MMPPKVTKTVERIRPYGLIALIILVSIAILLILAYGQKREENIIAIRDERRAQMDSLKTVIKQQGLQAEIEHAALNVKMDLILKELRDK